MRFRIILFAVVVAAAVPVAGLAATAKGSLHATMTGKAEKPMGDPDGRGTAEMKITGKRVCWELKVSRIAKPNAAHIHKGRPGVSGAVFVPLGGAYKAKGCTTTTAANARAILAKPGNFYVNVHNAAYPGGAVRGQLHS